MNLDEIIRSFEARTDDFHLCEIAGAIRDALKANLVPEETKATAYAEMDAFDFMPNATDWDSGWGLYYGPSMTIPQSKGGRIEIPNLAAISTATIDHWKRRALSCRHPLLKNRYADLVWELSQRVTGSRASPEFARVAIDAAIELSSRDEIVQVKVFERLERAMRLAISLRDTERTAQVKDALIDYEERRGEDDKPGTWGRSFALLIGEKLVKLTPEEEELLVRGLEERLARVSQHGDNVFNPHAAESTALQLATYYRARDRAEDLRRVLGTSADAFLKVSAEASGLPASSWLEGVIRNYESFGLTHDAAALQPALRDAHRRARGELVETRHAVTIPAEQIDRFVKGITSGTLEETLQRIIATFIVDRDVAERQVVEIAREAPIQALIPRVIVDDEGRPEAHVGSIEQDLDGHVAQHMTNSMIWQQLWVRAAFNGLAERHNPTIDQLCAFVFASPIFELSQQPLVRHGLELWLVGDIIGTAHVLVPQIEQAIRRIVMLTGGSHVKTARNGGFHYRLLDDLLRDPATLRVLGANIVRHLQVLLTDQRGLNVRNDIAHGYMPAERFTPIIADRIVHAILVLALVRIAPPSSTGIAPKSPPTSDG